MGLTSEDKTEIRQIINDGMSSIHARTEAKFEIIDSKLDGIHGRLDKINGSVARHEQTLNERAIKFQKIDDYMSNRNTGCPHLPAIQALQIAEKISISKKQLIISIITIIGIIIGIDWTSLEINNSLRNTENKNIITNQNKAMIIHDSTLLKLTEK